MLSRKSFPFLCFLFGVWWIQQVATNDDRPYLRILAPKFICNDKKANQTTNNNNLTISLQTREGQKLRYQISIDFEMLSGFKSQQHTLSIWKNIRLLQKKFSKSSTEISEKNQIEIDAKELTSDVVYTFKIVGFDDTNRSSETQNFSITFKGGELKAQQPDIGDGVSLLLLSSEFFYDDMEFLSVASVAFCDPIADYSFKWEVGGFDSAELDGVLGNSLWLPSGTFQPGKFLEVVVKLLNAESLTMASARLPVKILSKDFKVYVALAACLVGLDREIPIQAMIYRQQTSAVTAVKWGCIKDGSECTSSLNSSAMGLSQLVTFSSEGSFEIEVNVTINENVKSSLAVIEVDPKVIPHVQIKIFPSQPISVVQSNDFIVTVLNLIPKCFASWNIVADQGFAVLNEIEGNFTDMGYIFIKDFEEYFLQELVDYDNNTLSKDVVLAIPENALKPEEIYKFRLTVTCPPPITEGAPQTSTENVVSYYDIVVATNAPPVTLPLVVTPLTGVPMKTNFKFSTGAAKDSTSDFPLKYTFGYIVNNVTVSIETFYENTVTHSQLPLSDSIETFCDICDNNKACQRVIGPVVVVNTETTFADSEIEFKLKEFEAFLRRAEYDKSFNLAVVFLLTQQKFTSDTSSYETKMLSMMKQELTRLKSSSQSDMAQRKIVAFVKMSKNLMGLLKTTDEAFVNELLSLTELVKTSKTRIRRESAERSAKVVNHDPDYMRNVLGLMEMIFKSKNTESIQQEKPKFATKIHEFVSEMCSQNKATQKMSMDFVTLEVSKVHSPQLSTEPLIMPGSDNSATVLFALNANFPTKFVCVAKIKFMIDVFMLDPSVSPTSIFETIVMDIAENGFSQVINAAEVSHSVTVEIPSNDTSMTCLLWNGAMWSSDGCTKIKVKTSDRVGCKCKSKELNSFVFKAGMADIKPTVEPLLPTTLVVTDPVVLGPQPTAGTVKDDLTAITVMDGLSGTTIKGGSGSTVKEGISGTTAKDSLSGTTMKDGLSGTSLLGAIPMTEASVGSGTKASEAIKASSTTTQVQTTLPVSVTSPALSTSAVTPQGLNSSPAFSTPNPVVTIQSTLKTTLSAATTATSVKTVPLRSTLMTESAPTTVSSTPLNVSSNGTSANLAKADSTSIGLIVLLVIFFLVIVFLFFAHRCRKYVEQRMNLPLRTPANGIKYAKYHDEFIMQG